MRKYKPESVYYTLGGIVRLWPLIARVMGTERVVYNDGTSRLDMNYRSSFPLRLLMRPVTDLVCASEFIRSCTEREGFVAPGKCSVIYNSVPQTSELGDGVAFRQRYGIPKDRILILKISWLVPDKGIDVALQACREALRQRNDLHFVFCGDGENLQDYQRMAVEWGLTDHVTWTGQVEDLRTSGIFRAADIQIQCSQWHEAFCLAVAEGMSAGLPVVAARIGGLPELVVEGDNGYLFNPRDHLALAENIVRLAGNEALRKTMGEQGRQRAMERFNLTRNVHDWVRTLLPRDHQVNPYNTGYGHEDMIPETP
jgi:glycosyltransferase involved in cell wall biosynthesis